MGRTQARTLNRAVMARDGNQCTACGHAQLWTLAVHHVIPKDLGGTDAKSNLTTLCANCHRTVHWFSFGTRHEGSKTSKRLKGMDPTTVRILMRLATKARRYRERLKLDGGKWGTNGKGTKNATSLATALNRILQRLKDHPGDATCIHEAFTKLVKAIPVDVRRRCSANLVRGGKFLSVKANNHLAIRFPGIWDSGKNSGADFILMWPHDTRISYATPKEWKERPQDRFDKINCFNAEFQAEDVLLMTPQDFKAFGAACSLALSVGKTRKWISNVLLP